MENVSEARKEDHEFKLPAGFRFHPTDEELINQYLVKKVVDNCFCAKAIAEVDLNKCEPWDLPGLAKMGETEWYYFCVRDRKYPTGLRTNRATEAGYWKATGKDKEIIKENALIGMKKTLVFYKGRAPKGVKTNWVMHEYRLEGKHHELSLSKPEKSEWVICRVFEKSPCGRRVQVPKFGGFSSLGEEQSSQLPSLMDSSSHNSETRTNAGEVSQVSSYSDPNQTENKNTQDDIVDSMETPGPNLDFSSSSKPSQVPLQSTQIAHQIGSSQYQDCYYMPQGREFDADFSSVIYNNDMLSRLLGNQDHSSASARPVDTDCLWNY